MINIILYNEQNYIGAPRNQEQEMSEYPHKTVFEEYEEYDTAHCESLTVGCDETNDIILTDSKTRLVLYGNHVTVLGGTVYHNGRRTTENHITVENGDVIFTIDIMMIFRAGSIGIWGVHKAQGLWKNVKQLYMDTDFPVYKRSPRIIKRNPEDKIEVMKPEAKPQKNKGTLVRLIVPPLVTLSATIAMGVFMHRGMYVYITAATTVVTTIFSITNFFQEKKELKEKEKKRTEDYEKYLLNLRKNLNNLYEKQKEAMTFNSPSVSDISRLISEYSIRIYERAANDGDFLQVSLGRTTVRSSYQVSFEEKEFVSEEDPLITEMKEVCGQFTHIPEMPCVIDLKKAHLALVGEKYRVHQELKNIIAQVCFLQSYHDVEMIMLCEEEDRKEFEWVNWEPHFRVKTINLAGLITGETQRDQVLGNLAQVLKMRQEKKENDKKESAFLPHYIFIIDNPKLVDNHNIMEYLQSAELNLDFSIIYTSQFQASVPENIKTVFRLDGRENGTLILNEGILVNTSVKIENTESMNFEKMARKLYPLEHHKGITSQLPEQVTFFELYGIDSPSELHVERLWKQNACHKSLAVPFGIRGRKDILNLNLHEKAHGPHGLIAGTTGSGKSELIQTYILSLAVNFHPHEVGFLLIDYKGGGMANLFDNMPHMLGKITNLDGSEGMRALLSIRSELTRRQRVFNEHNVNSINQYTKLFRAGEAKEPLPHLFIISDEFAELKKEQPDFISELVSTARIGRSLGVHLILATQKPSGVVDDQIWSNSKFKIALKVQNESDSNEILRTPDAARITQPGRAYLQVGNNEVYELFQSAWSGAPYRKNSEKTEFDDRIYLINELGQGELLNEDLSEGADSMDTKWTQLDAVVEYMRKTYDAMDCVEVQKPWLEPLADKLVNPHITYAGDVGAIKECMEQVVIGMVDIPDMQEQKEYIHDFSKDGNMAVFGASGFGKSTVLMNMALMLASANSPELMNFYVMDFGNSALVPLGRLPHTADYMSFDDTEKIKKLVKILEDVMRERKQAFAKAGAINFKMYNTLAQTKIPMIILFIDNYDAVKETGMEMEEFLTKLSRDGSGVGIYVVFTASRYNSVRYAVLNNFKNKLALFMYEAGDITSVVGRSPFTLPEKKGRALVKQQSVNMMQCYLPVEYITDMTYLEEINRIVDTIRTNCTAKHAKPIPVLPEKVLQEMVADTEIGMAGIGLEREKVTVEGIDIREKTMIVGASGTGKTNILQLIANQKRKARLFIVDSRTEDMAKYADWENVTYLPAHGDLSEFIQKLKNYTAERKELYRNQPEKVRAKEFYASIEEACILVDNADTLVEKSSKMEKDMAEAVSGAIDTGIGLVTTTVPGRLRGYDALTQMLREAQYGIVLGNPMEQSYFTMPAIRGYQPAVNKGFVVAQSRVSEIKIAEAEG